jgi:hypothetical protein
MNDWQEINDLKRDPQRVRALAQRLLRLPVVQRSEKRTNFLNAMASRKDEISTSQAELLILVRDQTTMHSTVGGFSVAQLIEDCWRNRFPDRHRGLSDENCEFIESIKGTTILSRPQLLRLLFCCRQLGLIEEYIDIAA